MQETIPLFKSGSGLLTLFITAAFIFMIGAGCGSSKNAQVKDASNSTNSAYKDYELNFLDWTIQFSKKMKKDDQEKFYTQIQEDIVAYLKGKKTPKATLRFTFYEYPENTTVLRLKIDWTSTGSISSSPTPPPPTPHSLSALKDHKPELVIDNRGFVQAKTATVAF